MNKLLIVVMSICLISVHAFVKREAETETPKTDVFKDFSEKVISSVKEAMDPERLKTGFNDFVDKIHETIEQINAKNKEAKV